MLQLLRSTITTIIRVMLKWLKYILPAFLLFSSAAFSQVEDVELWTGAQLSHKFSRQFTADVTGQLRFDQNMSRLSRAYIQPGFDYNFSKSLRVGFAYRFISVNENDYYSKRHRL